ncbi:MAG: AsmA family protein [Alsobacter sp.]
MTLRLLIAGVGVSLLIGAGVTPWRLPADALGPGVVAGVGDPAGIVTLGAAELSMLPTPRLRIEGLSVRDPSGTLLLDVATLSGALRIWPLLRGRLAFADLSLEAPRISVPQGGLEALARRIGWLLAPEREGTGDPGLTRLTVRDGEIGSGIDQASSVLAVLRRSPLSDALELSLAMSWRGHPVEVEVSRLDAVALLRGNPSSLQAALRMPFGAAQFEGRIAGGSAPVLDGTLDARAEDPDALAAWLQLDLPVGLTGPAMVRTAIRAGAGGASLSGLRLTLPQGAFDGVVTVQPLAGRLAVSGTLASDRVDLTAALRPWIPMRGSDGGWGREPYDLAALPAGDLDLRVSADRLLIGPASITNAALTVIARNGRTDVALGNGTFHQGTVRGRIGFSAPGRAGVELRGQLAFERVDAMSASATLGMGRHLAGTASGSLLFEGHGETPAALLRSLEGRTGLVIRQGEIQGVNLPEFLKRLERRPLPALPDLRGGRTPFDLASLQGRISQGVVELTEGSVSSPSMRIGFGGQIGLGERNFAVAGSVLPPGDPGRDWPFELSGTFDAPLLLPDAGSLIRRAAAGAPLPFQAPLPLAVDAYAPR